MTLSKIENTQVSALEGPNKFFRIKFNVYEAPKAKLNAVITLSEEPDYSLPANEEYNWPPFPVHYEGMKQWAKLVYIYRSDSYNGPCEDEARKIEGLNPEVCMCKPDYIKGDANNK